MRFWRASGILVHPTSFPGPYGIGDLGPEAHRFLDFLVAAGQRLWQVLPLGPTGYGDSPYQSFSAFAGNPLLISLDLLVRDGWLLPEDLADWPARDPDRVDYGAVIPAKWALLTRAHRRFTDRAGAGQRAEYAEFVRREADWLDDFALFMALKQAHGGGAWQTWPAEARHREEAALARARADLADVIDLHRFVQWQFFQQWAALRAAAIERGLRIIGDVPIFVAYDSADVWANPALFHLEADGRPSVVAGVPPDYFSPTGQLWGNPLYRWEVQAATGYAWWLARLKATLRLVDIVRLDHFRGFEAYWEVGAGEETAIHGRWVAGPGAAFFEAVQSELGEMPLPFIAEDLGLITPPVLALRDAFDLPGMAVLQFAFGDDATNPYLPHQYRRNLVVYTGTHDNDTSVGWHAGLDEAQRRRLWRYGGGADSVGGLLTRLALGSVADTAITPLQDVLGLGGEARMNQPGRPAGNWTWRARAEALTDAVAAWLAGMTALYGRDGSVDRDRAERGE